MSDGSGNKDQGTEELDRAELLRRLQADSAPNPHSMPTVRAGDSVTERVELSDDLLNRARDSYENDDLPTSTFAMDELLEFEAVVDEHGRIALPASAIAGRFSPGTVLKIVARIRGS